jgi:DNA-binding transcriptional ArsR family regulator
MSKRAEQQLAGAALLFAALGDPTRLALLERLSRGGPASITTLADRFDLTRQGISKHLQVLSAARVIDGQRQGREHVWAINPDRLAEARRRLDLLSQGWDSALARLKAHVEEA